MISIKNKKDIETKIFSNTVEESAIAQVEALANYEPYSYSKIRVMPDVHAGKGCTIGTTMTITDKITPNLVGVDIGCGMLAVCLGDEDVHIDYQKLDEVIKKYVPTGKNIHKKGGTFRDLSDLRCKEDMDIDRAKKSIGTLGGGNHFIEVAKGEGSTFLIIHTGSRKLGLDVCNHYQKLAKVTSKEDKHLAYLEGKNMEDYLHDMDIAQRYAEYNRSSIAAIISEHMSFRNAGFIETIHNYMDIESMILRKGAVSAKDGETFIVPINSADGSLICVGKGNEDWNMSAPHGAGRIYSRTAAKTAIPMDDFKDSMKDVYTSSVMESTLDEAPQAYKPMKEILNAIEPTAKIADIIKPVYNYKAH